MNTTLMQILLSGTMFALIVQACAGFYWGGKISAAIENHEKRLDHIQHWVEEHDEVR